MSGCCDPRKPADFETENSRVRHRFAGVRHGLAEAGEAAFPPWDRMEHHRGQRLLPRPRNPAKPGTEKRVSAEKRRPQKRLCPPVRKKPAFLVGLYSWCAWTLRGDRPAPARKLPQKVRTEKRAASIVVCIPRGSRYHCTREISKNHRYKKELHNGDAGAPKCAKTSA